MNAIECRDLTKSYQGFTLDHITFTLPAGCILGLVGENGAGKSTTLKLLMNATSREDGQVSLLGTDNQSPDFLQTKQDIGVVLDEACLPEVITPLELGKLMSLTYTRWDQPLYESYLTRFDIPRTKQFKDFSRGMKMKLAIAAAPVPTGPNSCCWTRPPADWTPWSGTRSWTCSTNSPGMRPTRWSSPPTLSATWRRSVTTSPFFTRAS